MLIEAIAVVAAAAAGFGIGRIKNAATVAAIKAELVKIEGEAVADVKAAIARIRAKL